ncbi:hypothetical protein E2562_026101 [Oryza meyeriana var. granulata]|uniref:Uncharacterized protein n=1 Tax=Oryza meyeriana var. granulata TaxID=110450 RepID=A0A6G1C1M9_9ORYZ|nr:hypothetical protein E2562_026101 [Oryza meyeriana var. granulata]
MDESEAGGPISRWQDYLEYGHRTRDGTKNKDRATSTTVPEQQTSDSSCGTRARQARRGCCRQEGITMSKKLTAVMDKIGTHGV